MWKSWVYKLVRWTKGSQLTIDFKTNRQKLSHCSISSGTNPEMALVISNPLHVSKELTFKWHVSNFHVKWTINNKATLIKETLLLHLCKKWKKEFPVLIKHCYLIGNNAVQVRWWLEKCCFHSTPLKTTIYRWYADLKHSRTNTNDVGC